MAVTIGHFVGDSSGKFHALFGNTTSQIDSQKLADQLGNLIMDVNRGVSYQKGSSYTLDDSLAGGRALQGQKNEKEIPEPSGADKCLTLYNKDCIHTIWWEEKEKAVYYQLQTGSIQENADQTGAKFVPDGEATKKTILAQNVEEFAVNLSSVEPQRVVKFQFVMSDARDKVIEENITLRNKVKVNCNMDEVYQAEDMTPDTEATTETEPEEPTTATTPEEPTTEATDEPTTQESSSTEASETTTKGTEASSTSSPVEKPEEIPEEETIYLAKDAQAKISLADTPGSYGESYFLVYKDDEKTPSDRVSSKKFHNNDYLEINMNNSNKTCTATIEWVDSLNLEKIDYIEIHFFSGDSSETEEKIVTVYPKIEEKIDRNKVITKTYWYLWSGPYEDSYFKVYFKDGTVSEPYGYDTFDPNSGSYNQYLNIKSKIGWLLLYHQDFTISLDPDNDFAGVDHFELIIQSGDRIRGTIQITLD